VREALGGRPAAGVHVRAGRGRCWAGAGSWWGELSVASRGGQAMEDVGEWSRACRWAVARGAAEQGRSKARGERVGLVELGAAELGELELLRPKGCAGCAEEERPGRAGASGRAAKALRGVGRRAALWLGVRWEWCGRACLGGQVGGHLGGG
jgi:hypothetical protein